MRSRSIAAGLITAVLLFVNLDNSFAASKKPSPKPKIQKSSPKPKIQTPSPKPKIQPLLLVTVSSALFTYTPIIERDEAGNFVRITSGPCSNSNKYSDLTEGVQVIVENEQSLIIAKSQMKWSLTGCDLRAAIGQIPISQFYKISVGTQKPFIYSHDELVQQRWSVSYQW